ncbi:uncharacterized protein LOC126888560 [Diabrotica virgifera virgifera]|uniref:Uncharacterized protein n=1 Tax=Diabrotica virgifera virgifera TaxID=50390 RepID=A0ABM5KRP7_DIAVI|nr:uncharacterized protein LOC126888560 [Diabrotica virgifera virgifera]
MYDSDDSTTADESGKRKATDVLDVFQQSKKTTRSPKKDDGYNKEMLTQIMSMLKNLKEDTEEIRKQQKEQDKKMKEISEELKELKKEQIENKNEISAMKNNNEKMLKEINNLQKEIMSCNERIQYLESDKRRKNIVIQGIPITTNNPKILRESVKNFIDKEMGIEVQINEARKLGDKIYLVELDSKYEKMKIMKNIHKLKKLPNRIYINDDTKIDANGFALDDLRGKHGKHRKNDPELITDIKWHINSIPRVESHCLRVSTSREYIDGSKTIKYLYNDFKLEQERNNKEIATEATTNENSRDEIEITEGNIASLTEEDEKHVTAALFQ